MNSTAPAGSTGTARANRLAGQTSPYLLQHASNPVDWWPWGPEAIAAARQADKPIFLSIGYSTCYWCHVMERESFEDKATAQLMNQHFICIKVDREERPDVDDIHMAAVQIMTRSGGWPMSVFLEPHGLKPFMAGTYFPPRDAFGRPSFQTVLRQMADAWGGRRGDVNEQADALAEAVTEHLAASAAPTPVGPLEVDAAVAALMGSYDPIDGGFVAPRQRAPKFPTPVNLEFLIGAAWDRKEVRDAVLHTLDRMAIGGMFDQVGGGFHRYSVDAEWLVPHFEKMLYDQGQLAVVYAAAHGLTGDEFLAHVLRRTLDYVLREMTTPEGAFISAQDAEVNAREGQNYLWKAEQVREVLNGAGLGDDVEFALRVYGLDDGPNFQDPHHPGEPPSNVMFLAKRPDVLAQEMNIAAADFNTRLQAVNSALLKARSQRDQPSSDDKVLAGWNGLMIAGLAEGGRVLREPKYVEAAARAATFVLQSMRAADGGLLRTCRGGEARIDAFLEDYAFMIKGLLALYRADGDRRWLTEAELLAAAARDRFWDPSAGGFFDTLTDQSDLFVRVKSGYDGAVPSGNGEMLLNLLELHEAATRPNHLEDAAATMRFMSAKLKEQPAGCILTALALHRMAAKHPQKLDKPAHVVAASSATTPPGAAPRSSPPASAQPSAKRPVVAMVSPVEVKVKPGQPARFTVNLSIFKGFHVNAHEPGDDFLIPLKVELTGVQGVAVKVEYPAGTEFHAGEISSNTIRVHEGEVSIPVTLEQTGKFSGTPRLLVTWQACTHQACLEPKTQALGLRILAER